MLISRISYKCKWGLTGFYPTKELCFDVTTAMAGYMLAVILLKNINTLLWLGVYLSYNPWYTYLRYTPIKPFEVGLQWDRSNYSQGGFRGFLKISQKIDFKNFKSLEEFHSIHF